MATEARPLLCSALLCSALLSSPLFFFPLLLHWKYAQVKADWQPPVSCVVTVLVRKVFGEWYLGGVMPISASPSSLPSDCLVWFQICKFWIEVDSHGGHFCPCQSLELLFVLAAHSKLLSNTLLDFSLHTHSCDSESEGTDIWLVLQVTVSERTFNNTEIYFTGCWSTKS